MTDWTDSRARRVLAEIFLAPDPTDVEAHAAWCEAADSVMRDEALADDVTPEEMAAWTQEPRHRDGSGIEVCAAMLERAGLADEAACVRRLPGVQARPPDDHDVNERP